MAALPTPLEEMPRLTAELGGPRILIKREDMTGLAFGGNKARHYEYELPHVRDEGYDAMINVMDYHSKQRPHDLRGGQQVRHALRARPQEREGKAGAGQPARRPGARRRDPPSRRGGVGKRPRIRPIAEGRHGRRWPQDLPAAGPPVPAHRGHGRVRRGRPGATGAVGGSGNRAGARLRRGRAAACAG